MERVLQICVEMKSFVWTVASCGLLLPLAAVLSCAAEDDTKSVPPASLHAETHAECPAGDAIQVGEPCELPKETRCPSGRSQWPPNCPRPFEAPEMCSCGEADAGGPRVWSCEGTFAILCAPDAGHDAAGD